MKKLLPQLFFFYVFNVVSQQGILKGKIIDFKTKEPLSYVNIICKDAQGKLINGSITNQKGLFTIKKLLLKDIKVNIQFIGYQPINKDVKLTSEKSILNLGTLLLKENTTTLDEVEVRGETSTIVQKTDRKVFNVGKDLSSSGTSSLEMLENIPTVNVDFQTKSISLRGNENVTILVDGKPSNLSGSQILSQIPASNVKSVELITNPSAKYNPEGMSGIINIILKKSTIIGFNGSFTIGVEHSKNTRPSGSLDLNYRTGKVNFYGNYSIDLGKFETKAFFDRPSSNLQQTIDYLDDSKSHYSKAGLDFYINDKNTVSLYTTHVFNKTDFLVNSKIHKDSNLFFNSPNTSFFDASEETYNIDYKLILDDKGQNIELELNYSKSKTPQEDINTELINPASTLYNYNNSIINDNSILLINLDYTKPIKNGTLELGLESKTQKAINNIITNQEIETSENNIIPYGNSNFNYNRETYSAYINVSKEYKKLSIQAGVRFEQFLVNGLFSNTQQTILEPYKDDISSIYPSAFLTFKASENNEFQIGYSRRVDRPGIDQVTPIQEWNSPLTLSVGNRTLRPQFTDSFETNYTRNLKNGFITFGAFYRKTSDKIGRIINRDILNIDRQIFSYTNYNAANSYGLELSASFNPTSWWTLKPSASLYIQDSQGIINNTQETVKNTLLRANFNNNFKASKKLRFNISTTYRGKSENVQFKINPLFLVNASARLTILDSKGSLTLRGTDIFDNYKLNFSTSNPFLQTGFFSLEYSAIYLGFTYNFGSGKNRERDRKYREENETQGSGGVL